MDLEHAAKRAVRNLKNLKNEEGRYPVFLFPQHLFSRYGNEIIGAVWNGLLEQQKKEKAVEDEIIRNMHQCHQEVRNDDEEQS